jgi:hypothetical protein
MTVFFDVAVPEVGLDQARIVGGALLVREGKTAGVAQHVRVDLELEASKLARTLDDELHGIDAQRPAALADEDEGRVGFCLEALRHYQIFFLAAWANRQSMPSESARQLLSVISTSRTNTTRRRMVSGRSLTVWDRQAQVGAIPLASI